MAQKIKMLAFDVDGTFVNNDKEVPKENLELLKRLSKKNVKMVLSTGRMPVSAMDLTRDLGLGVHTSACNGASMYLNDGNENFELIDAKYYEYDLIKELLEYLDSLKIRYHFYEKDHIYTNRTFEEVKKFYKLFVRNIETIKIVDSLSKALTPEMRVLKSGIAEDGTFDFQAVKAHLEQNKKLDVRLSHASYLDINPAGINKWEGIKLFMDHFGIQKEEVMYFGDHENDLECIQNAGFGVAMQNSLQSVKEKAGFVTDFNNDDAGMARFVEKLEQCGMIEF